VEDVLLEAIAAVAAGRRYTSPEVMRSLADRALAPSSGREAVLSQRENQILAGLGRGETTDEMSRALNISFHTVETYYGRLQRKLALSSMNELRKFAIRRRG
jgi:DNA-binding NarL/FixJ family response regulator